MNSVDFKNKNKESEDNLLVRPKLRSYSKILAEHKRLSLIEDYPSDFTGKTIDEIASFLGIKDKKPAIFQTPIEIVKIYKSNILHMNPQKDSTRILGLSRAVRTLIKPSIVIQDKKENYYIKFFKKLSVDKIHLQVIRTTKKDGFYKTNFPMSKNRFENMKGQIIYDLSSKRGN